MNGRNSKLGVCKLSCTELGWKAKKLGKKMNPREL